MRFLNSRNEIVSLKFKARIYMFLKTQYFHKMLHSLVLNQTFHCKEVNKSGKNDVSTMQAKSLYRMQHFVCDLALLVPYSGT